MADAFGQLLDVLLGPLGVVVFDGSDPAAKPLASTIFQRVLAHPGHTRHLASDAGQALVADGYHAQVVAQPDATALFSMVERPRCPSSTATSSSSSVTTPVDAATLRADAAAHPERFSPNVLLRAVVQDTLLPTIAYVAGPSELAYLGQLKDVYAFHETPMPLIVQRATGTILDSASLRFLARTSLELQSLQAQDEHVLNQWLESQLPPTLEQALHDLEHTLDDRMAALLAAVPALDPTLDGAVKSAQGRMAHEVRGPARQGDQRRQAPPRDVAPSIRARAAPGVPRRPPAGTRAVPGLVHEPVRSGPRAPTVRVPAHRGRQALAAPDLTPGHGGAPSAP